MLLRLLACAFISKTDYHARLDVDGDGVPILGAAGIDCDDRDASVGVARSWYEDADGDGFGAGPPFEACMQPAGAVAEGADCDDTDSMAYPGAQELCDDKQDDCSVAWTSDAGRVSLEDDGAWSDITLHWTGLETVPVNVVLPASGDVHVCAGHWNVLVSDPPGGSVAQVLGEAEAADDVVLDGVDFGGPTYLQAYAESSVAFSGLTITGGNDGDPSLLGGGVSLLAGHLSLSGVVVKKNIGLAGGGIYVGSAASLELTGGEVNNNEALSLDGVSGCGGGIANFGTLSISGAEISKNTATISEDVVWYDSLAEGGGIHNAKGATAVITASPDGVRTLISENSSILGGGGIDNVGTMTLDGVDIQWNYGGDPIYCAGGGGINNRVGRLQLVIRNSDISNNTSVAGGGGINGNDVALIDSTVADNVVTFGGGGGAWVDTLYCSGSVVSGNTVNVGTACTPGAPDVPAGGGLGYELEIYSEQCQISDNVGDQVYAAALDSHYDAALDGSFDCGPAGCECLDVDSDGDGATDACNLSE